MRPKNFTQFHSIRFLMEDLTMKVESIYGVRKFGPNCMQNMLISADFLSDTVQMMPNIMFFYTELANQLKIIIDRSQNGDIDDNLIGLFTDENNYIKICFGLCLRLLAALYTWPGFEEGNHSKILEGS